MGMLPDVSPQITLLLVSPFGQLLPPERVLMISGNCFQKAKSPMGPSLVGVRQLEYPCLHEMSLPL